MPNHENPLYWIETSPLGSTVTSGRLPEKVAR
jgi:hypothetical protein